MAKRKTATAEVEQTLETEITEMPQSLGDLTVAPVGGGQITAIASNNETFGGKQLSPARLKELASKINLKDRQSIITYGTEAQKKSVTVSEKMIENVKTKDVGHIGDTMNDMVRGMKGLNLEELQGAKKPGFFARLLRLRTTLDKFLDRYRTIEEQITAAVNVLDGHRIQMLKDAQMLDRQYDATLNLKDEIEEYILALDWVMVQVNEVELPKLKEAADASGDMGDVQALRDLTEVRDQLERKRHDMLLIRNITIQALPGIRMIQSNDNNLADKIQTQITTSVNLWKQQLAVSVAAWRSEQAGRAVRSATDYTNELIVSSAKAVNSSNAIARKEIERGIFDVAAAMEANDILISTITESIDIAEKGKADRAKAEQDLIEAENKLKDALKSAAERQRALNDKR